MSFLNELKIAVINKDLKKLEELSNKEVEFSSIDEAKEINNYLKEAKKIILEEKLKLNKEMQEIKKLQNFYNSHNDSKFNLKF